MGQPEDGVEDSGSLPLLPRITRDKEPPAELFRTPGADGVPYITLTIGDHLETWPLHSRVFRHYLERRLYLATGRFPPAHTTRAALGILTGEALFHGPERSVWTRVAEHPGGIYLDLGDPAWRAVAITSQGWCVVRCPTVKFRRARGLLALPDPIRGGRIDELRAFLNLATEEDYRLVTTWLLAALRPHGPYPVLVLQGEPGAAKSTAARVLRMLCDPNTSPLRASPRDMRDLMIAATNSWLMCFDNLDHVPPWLSNALCRIATGGGFATRRHYTDDGEVLFDATRPILLNGIEELATRGDLLDRALIVQMPSIASSHRRPELLFWEDFHRARPTILGGLLDALVHALAILPSVRAGCLPRMADFVRFGLAVERAFGWPAGAFLAAYGANREAGHEIALEASLLAGPVCALVRRTGRWTGTAGELLSALAELGDESTRRRREWPKTPTALGGQLRRLAPTLREAGVEVRFQRAARSRTITLEPIERTVPTSSTLSAPSAGGGQVLS